MLPWNCMKVKTPGHVTEVKCDVLEVCGPAISPVLNNGIAVQHCLHPWTLKLIKKKEKRLWTLEMLHSFLPGPPRSGACTLS